MICSAVLRSAGQGRAGQCSAVQCSAVQCSAVQGRAAQGRAQGSEVRAGQCSTFLFLFMIDYRQLIIKERPGGSALLEHVLLCVQ